MKIIEIIKDNELRAIELEREHLRLADHSYYMGLADGIGELLESVEEIMEEDNPLIEKIGSFSWNGTDGISNKTAIDFFNKINELVYELNKIKEEKENGND